jgi:outer membrane protein TolC
MSVPFFTPRGCAGGSSAEILIGRSGRRSCIGIEADGVTAVKVKVKLEAEVKVEAEVDHLRAVRCLLLAAILALSGIGATAAAADLASTTGLTLAGAQRLALARSRQLGAQDAAVIASREMAVAAGQLPDPVLKAGVDNLPVSGADRFSLSSDFMTRRRIGVMQEWTGTEKRRARAGRFETEADKTLAEKTVTAAAIERDTALAWLERYYSEAMAAVVAEQGAQATLEIQAAQGAYRAGRGSQADLLAARSAMAEFDDRASEAARRVRSAKSMLARWAGEAANLPLYGQPSIDSVRLDPARLDTQLAHHPEIAVLQKQEDLARADARVAEANRSADWSFELAYQQRGPAYSNMLSVGVSIPLQWDRKNRQDRELSARLALVDKAKAEREENLRMHVAETRVLLDEWENGRERIARFERERIPLANERTLAAVAAYRGGKAALTDVLAARRDAIAVRIQALQLQADTARLWAQLNFLTPDVRFDATSPAMMQGDAK